MEARIARYIEIKNQMEALDAERKQIADSLRSELEAQSATSIKVNGFKVSIVSRITHSVNWKLFVDSYKELYNILVTDKNVEYVEVRKSK